MVRDAVWEAASRGGQFARILCIGCLEQRLGRRLAPNDADLGINELGDHESDRLLDRLGVADSDGKTEV